MRPLTADEVKQVRELLGEGRVLDAQKLMLERMTSDEEPDAEPRRPCPWLDART